MRRAKLADYLQIKLEKGMFVFSGDSEGFFLFPGVRKRVVESWLVGLQPPCYHATNKDLIYIYILCSLCIACVAYILITWN